MNEASSMYSNLSNQTQFRFNKISKIKDYFIDEIQERERISKRLSKYIAAFDYFHKTLLVLPATSEGISIISFSRIIEVPVGIARYLKQPRFAYSVCGQFNKNREKIQKFMQTGNTNYIYSNDLNKACFQHDMAFGRY